MGATIFARLPLAAALTAVLLLATGCGEGRARDTGSSGSAVVAAGAAAGDSAAPAAGAPATPAGLSRYALAGAPGWRATLPGELREVSGLAVGANGRLFAHGDEEATIFELDPRAGRVLKRFTLAPTGREPDLGKKGKGGRVTGDFEDIAIVGDRFFLVTSNGVLVEFAEGEDGASVPYTAYTTGLGARCEVEGLAHDAGADALLLLCKEFHAKPERDRVAVYAWSIPQRRLDPSPRLALPYSTLASVTGAAVFNGSALALTPDRRWLVLLAGPQRLFAGVTADGKYVEGGQLDRTAHPQPEGIAFLPDGTLLISNEGGKGTATISGYPPR